MSDRLTAEEVIARLGLVILPGEGGWYRETYRATRTVSIETGDGPGRRSLQTAIYYLLTPTTHSALHRLASDEVYHFYAGDPVELVYVDGNGSMTCTVLGNRLEQGQTCQLTVPAGVWQGSALVEGGAWGLMGTTVAPGFEFEDFELASRADVAPWADMVRKRVERLLATGLRS